MLDYKAEAIYDYIMDNMEGQPLLVIMSMLDSVKFRIIVEQK
jgi:hypothetical protein